jgi:hypothetical protein
MGVAPPDGLRSALSSLARRPTLAAGAVYALLAFLMVLPGAVPDRLATSSDQFWRAPPWTALAPPGVDPLGSNFALEDSITQFQPNLLYTRAALPDIPLWNPHIMGGRPFVGNAQSAVFSPFSLPAYVLPFWHSFAVVAALKLWTAALGMFLLGRALGMRFGGALLAGVVFAFAQWTVDWLAWPLTNVWVLTPWLLLLTERVLRAPRSPAAPALALVVGIQYLGGHPESSYDVLLITVVFFLTRLFWLKRSGLSIGVPLAAFAAALAAGTFVAAVAIIPFVELLALSSDVRTRSIFPASTIPSHYLTGIVLPDYWGRPGSTDLNPYGNVLMQDRAFYVGALTLMLGVAGVLIRPSPGRIALTAAAIFGLAAVVDAEPAYSLVTLLPGPVRPDRMTFIFVLASALLAGFGLDELSRDRPVPRRTGVVLVALALLVGPVLGMALAGKLSLDQLGIAWKLAWRFADLRPLLGPGVDGLAAVRLGALLEWIVFAGAAAALLLLRVRRRIGPALFVALAVLLIAGDLFKLGVGFNPALPTDEAVQPSTDGLRYLQSRRPARFVGMRGNTVAAMSPLPPNTAMRWGLFDARGYDFPVEDRYTRLWDAGVEVLFVQPRFQVSRLTPTAIRALSVLSVADIAQDPREPPIQSPRLPIAYDGPDLRIYENPFTLPRAFVVNALKTVEGRDASLRAILDPAFDLRRAAVSEGSIRGLPETSDAAPVVARIVDYKPELVVVNATAKRRGLLVLTDTFFPGWKATVDDEDAAIHRVNFLHRGVVIPPGTHEVTFTYRPASWRAGWIVTLLALAGILLWAWLVRRRRAPST